MFKRWQRVGSRPLLHRRGAAGSAPTAPRRYPQAILDPIWQALNIGRDNEGLLLAQAGRIINVNPLLLQLWGRSLSELVGREVASELFAPSLTASRWESLLKTAVGEPIAIEITRQEFAADLGQFEVYAVRDLAREQALESQARHSRALQQREAQGASRQVSEHFTELADGRYIAVSIQPMANGGMVMTHQDITEQRRSEAKIAHMALHDALTNLPNRVLLNERLEHTLFRSRRGEMVATHILDLDHFKHLNDTLGHLAGDKLLQMVANRLRALVRNTDTVARMGGDGFAIVRVALAQIVDATSLAQRVITALSEPYDIDGQQVMIGTSVGITLAPSDGLLPEQLIRNGDLALYRAKGDGRGTFRFFEAEMDVRMQTRRPLEQDLRKAVVAGELELHFQPVINIASGKISCLEALVRWQHPQDGLVSPATFIPLAEETGLIVPIGEWVIRQACATAARWPADLKLAVNLSPAQLRNPGLPQMLISALAASGLAPDRLIRDYRNRAAARQRGNAGDPVPFARAGRSYRHG